MIRPFGPGLGDGLERRQRDRERTRRTFERRDLDAELTGRLGLEVEGLGPLGRTVELAQQAAVGTKDPNHHIDTDLHRRASHERVRIRFDDEALTLVGGQAAFDRCAYGQLLPFVDVLGEADGGQGPGRDEHGGASEVGHVA